MSSDRLPEDIRAWFSILRKAGSKPKSHKPGSLNTSKHRSEREGKVQKNGADVEHALAELPDQEREILVRTFLKDQSPEQISHELQITKGSLGRLKRSAMERFRQNLASADRPEARTNPRGSSIIQDPVVQILMSAAAAFENVDAGRSWLLTPNPSLGNVAPISLITTPKGRKLVANELGLIEHGMF